MDSRGKSAARLSSADFIDGLVVAGLTFLASDPERLGRFFDVTGLTLQTLRDTAAGDGFASSLLHYLGSDEAMLRAFAAEHGYDPAEIDAARRRLDGPGFEY